MCGICNRGDCESPSHEDEKGQWLKLAYCPKFCGEAFEKSNEIGERKTKWSVYAFARMTPSTGAENEQN